MKQRAGTVALSVAKGGRLHKSSGLVFSVSMILTGFLAAIISAYAGKSVIGPIFVVYLIFIAVTTVKPLPGRGRSVDVALMIVAFWFAAGLYWGGAIAWAMPGHTMNNVPAAMIFFLATVALLAAVGDARMIRADGLRGPRRIARHLWRMCFGLYIATGSFFLGQMKFVPEPIRIVPLLFALAVAPLVILLYWMWRVRLRRRLKGLIISSPVSPTA